jgi:D-lyxose ketol-isomerase
MKTEHVNRKWSVVLLAGLVCVAIFMTGCQKATTSATCCSACGPSIEFDNATFYDANGTFLPDVAKDAYITLMEYHGYPVFPDVKDKLWVSDYGTGEFTKLGLGANSFINNEEDRYMSMDLFLLPSQMLPEHFHLSTDKNPSKMEGWTVRHGVSYVYGEGEPTVPMKAVVPQCHMKGTVTVKHEVILSPGEFTPLVRATAPHWQFGGPEGTIMTETATVHDNDGVRHSDLNLVFP